MEGEIVLQRDRRLHMRKAKKALALFLTAALVISPFGGNEEAEAKKKKKKENVKVSSVKITNADKKLRLQKGKRFKLKTEVKVSPNKKKYKKLKFTSSNKKVVVVNSKGLLKGKKKGTAKITVASKSNSKKKATISVTVTNEVLVKTIKLNKTKITADEFNDEDIQLKVTKILPANAKDKDIEWSSDNEDVADVDEDGLVTTGDVGTATITATAADGGGATATCKVVVTKSDDEDEDDEKEGEEESSSPVTNPPVVEPPVTVPEQNPVAPSQPEETIIAVTNLSIGVTTDWLAPGDTSRLNVSYAPVNTTQSGVIWTVNNEAVTVSEDGKVKVDENFTFGEDDTEQLIVITATSKFNPTLSKSVVLTVYDPTKVEAPKLENPDLDLSESMVPQWALGGVYGKMTFNEDGTITYNSDNSSIAGKPNVCNNGCAWYLNSGKCRTDISDYKYMMITVDADVDALYNIKLMTWTGSDDSEFFWDKKDSWGDKVLTYLENEDGTTTIIYRTDTVFQNTKNAKSVGITIKSWDGENEELFVVKEAIIKDIRFSGSLPDGCVIEEGDDIASVKLSNSKVSLTEDKALSWVLTGEFGTTIFNEDGTISFNSQPANENYYGNALNNGCAWYLEGEEDYVDVSDYNYVYVKVKSDAVVDLMTWSANTTPEGYYNKKVLYTPGAELENADGSKTLVYRVSTAFSNVEKARAIGILVESGSGTAQEYKDGDFVPRDADIYEIGFTVLMPEADEEEDEPSVSPSPTPTPEDVQKGENCFTDLFSETMSDATITAVTDTEGTPCTEINFTNIYQRAFFELPTNIEISDYDTISIKGNVPKALSLNTWTDSLDMETEDWWSTYSSFVIYPFYEGSYTDRVRLIDAGTERGVETQTYSITDGLGVAGDTKYISIGSNATPIDGFGSENYLIYSITLESSQEDVPSITLESTEEGTTTPSTTTQREVFTPTTDEYEIVLSEDTETTATKDKEGYRTDVVFGEDGSVSYTNVQDWNSGMVFMASADGKRVDLSEYDYVEVDMDAPMDMSLKAFNDASSWWNKVEVFEGEGESGRRTHRYSLANLEENGLDLSKVDGFGVGLLDNFIGETVTIYSIKVVKASDSSGEEEEEIESTSISMNAEFETEWTSGGYYGSQTYNEDGTVTYSTMPENVSVETDTTEDLSGSVYNNGCGWYLNDLKEFVDISDYSYVRLTIATNADIKLMTWSGEDAVASSYWNKKDSWGDNIAEWTTDEEGNNVLLYEVDTVFEDPTQAQAIGVTLKSCDDDQTVFVEKQAVIKSIEFVKE